MAGVPAVAPMARQDAGASGYAVAARAFSGLASTVAHTGNELLRVQAALQAEDAKLDMQTRFNQLKLDFGLREAEIRDGIAMPQPGGATATDVDTPVGLDTPPPPVVPGLPALVQPQAPARVLQPKDYAATFSQEIDRMVEDSARGLKYPGLERQYRAHVAEWVGRQKIEALNRGIKLQHEAIVLTDDLAAREEANTAVFGAPEERQQAFQARLGRIQSFVARGIYSGEKGAALTKEFLGNVERGEAQRDFRIAERRPVVMDRLVSGQYKHIPPAESLELARTLQDRMDTQTRQAEADARREFGEERDTIVRDLFSRAADGTLTKAELDQWAPRWRMTREQYEQVLNEIRRPVAEKDTPSDPATRERVEMDTHSARPTMTEDDVRALRDRVLLNRKDALAAMDRLRAARKDVESEQMQRHNQGEQSLRAALGITSPLDVLDQPTKKAYNLALQEYTRRSSAYGGKEDPLAVVESLIPRYQKMLGQDSRVTEQQAAALLRYPSAAALEAARQSKAISEGEYQSQKLMFMEADRLRRERELREAGELLQQQLNKALGKPAPKSGAASSSGGKVLGR